MRPCPASDPATEESVVTIEVRKVLDERRQIGPAGDAMFEFVGQRCHVCYLRSMRVSTTTMGHPESSDGGYFAKPMRQVVRCVRCEVHRRGVRVVGITGFEPATSWSRTKRSTRLSYIPNFEDSVRDSEQGGDLSFAESFAGRDPARRERESTA